MADTKLTGKQKLWADAYIVTLNQTESSRMAGYAGDDNVLANVGSMNVRNPKIMAYINERLEQHAMSAQEVLIRLTDIARGDIADTLNSAGGIDPLEAKRRGKSHLIKRFKTKITTMEDREIYETEVEMHDALKAQELLAKYHDLVNRVKFETWEDRVIADIRAGNISYDQIAESFDKDLAHRLFLAAGVPVNE